LSFLREHRTALVVVAFIAGLVALALGLFMLRMAMTV
jgi:hypothetical protein